MSESIGKFTAPGTGDVGVLGIELTHDFDTGMKEGVVRLEKRPYWEGCVTPFTLEMPATSERAAMHLMGLWMGRGLFDGKSCDITVTGVTTTPAHATSIPATPTLDELTDPADLDWGTIRSTCAARDWRAAWGVVGTDHTGDATPGEVYLLAVARRASATAAALHHWRAEFKATVDAARNDHNAKRLRSAKAWRDIAPLPLYEESWQRIKRIAAWESSARAQYDERGNRRGRLQAAVREQLIDAQRELARQARLYGRDNVSNDTLDTLDALRQLSAAVQAADTTVRPTNMWIDEATLDALRQRAETVISPGYAVQYDEESDPELYGNGRGVPGVLNNPFLSAAAQRGEITGTMTFRHDGDQLLARYGVTAEAPITITASNENAADFMARGGVVGAVVLPPGSLMDAMRRETQRQTNPAPRGPQTRKRR